MGARERAAWATLGDGVDLTTEDGIAMELRAFAMTIFNSEASDRTITDLVDSVLARKDELPFAVQLLSSAIYIAVSMRLNRTEGLPFTLQAVLRPSPQSGKCPSRTLTAWRRSPWPVR